MRILNFGSCNLDIVYTLEHIVTPGQTIAAQKLSHFPGGKGLNQSVALARAGASVFHAGFIGEDGGLLYQTLSQAGVDLRYLRTVSQPSGHAIIQVDRDGENAIIIYPGANAAVTREFIDHVLGDFLPGDMLLLQNEISQLPYLVSQAAEKGLRIILNPSPFSEELRQLDLNQIQYLLLNEGEAESLFHSQDPDTVRHLLKCKYPGLTVVLTLGKGGSAYITANTCFRQSAYCTETVDTTSAGDTFTGFFVAEISGGSSPETAMRIASAAAALAVSQQGAASSIPFRDTVLRALPNLKSYTEMKGI